MGYVQQGTYRDSMMGKCGADMRKFSVLLHSKFNLVRVKADIFLERDASLRNAKKGSGGSVAGQVYV